MTKSIQKKPKVTSQWTADFNGHKCYAKTKKELLERCAKEIERTEAEGKPWTLAHEWETERTYWPKVLIINRNYETIIDQFNNKLKGNSFHWIDSSGSRSVYWYGNKFVSSYNYAIDLPIEVFESLKNYFKELEIDEPFMMRREDPGLGIYIPEIDNPIREMGCLPDGVMALTGGKDNEK